MSKDELNKILTQITLDKDTQPNPSWKNKTRGNLMYFIRTNIPIQNISRPVYSKILGFSILSLVLIFAGTYQTIVLASESKPGDKLYSFGRVVEKTKLAIADNSSKKELIRKQLSKRVEELEYSSQLETEKYEEMVVNDLKSQTEEIINNDNFTLDEKREIAALIDERLDEIENNKKRESLSEDLKNVRVILSKTQIKIEHKTNTASTEESEENKNVGGMNEEDSQRIPEELKKIENNSKSKN